eukprot:TRINITY_DN18055_c0_g1_i1.p1 TRINITY_DN18055_c0_g1~~TRINITY_DN18055_c0_g1_i1.p1  ORF type:complete len:565 (+),score=109.24 TRINITY_DN18055_c0_g1_i1:49-1743(+)
MEKKGGQLGSVEKDEDIKKNEQVKEKDPRKIAQWVVGSLWFDCVTGGIIVTNAATQAWEQALTIDGRDTTFLKVIESLFLVIYIFEILLRYYALGSACLKDIWVKFDLFVVTLGMLTSWVLEPSLTDWPEGIGLLVVFRLTRLLRIIRTLRVLVQVRDFWLLVRGFAASLKLMLYTFGLVFVLIYVFSVIGVEIITKHRLNMGDHPDSEFRDHVDRYFATLPRTMLTLMRYVCMDEMSQTYSLLVEKDAALVPYFIGLIICLGIIVMNLVGAVIFTGTLDMNKEEHDQARNIKNMEMHRLIEDLKALFLRLDEDNSGTLTRDEIKRISPEDHEKLSTALGVNSPLEVFMALDTDQSGRVSIEEFFDGIVDVALKDSRVDMKRIERQLSSMSWRLSETFLHHAAEKAKLESMHANIDYIKKHCGNGFVGVHEFPGSMQLPTASSTPRAISSILGPEGKDLPPWAKDLLGKLHAITISAEDQIRAIASAKGSGTMSRRTSGSATTSLADEEEAKYTNTGGDSPVNVKVVTHGSAVVSAKARAMSMRQTSGERSKSEPAAGRSKSVR